MTGCFQTWWAIWISCHIWAIFRKTEKPLSLLSETEEIPWSRQHCLRLCPEGPRFLPRQQHCQLFDSKQSISEHYKISTPIPPAPGPELPPSQPSAASAQPAQWLCSGSNNNNPQIPRAVLSLSPPSPEILRCGKLTLVIRHLATLLHTHFEPCVE